MTKLMRASLLGLAILPAALSTAHAEAPQIVYGGSFDTKFQAETTKVTGQSAKGTIYNDSDFQAYVNVGEWVSFNTDVKLERQRNGNMNDYFQDTNSSFRSEGATLRQLYATLHPTDTVSAYGGKIHPKFGSAWGKTPGLFYNFASDYEQDERIGLGAEVTLPEWTGKTQLSAETYFLDTSVLSNSVGSRPSFDDDKADRARKYRRDAGGPSNTGRLNSYTIALQGSDAANIDGLGYQLSYTHEGVSLPDERAENGWSAGASYEINLGRRVTMVPFGEYTSFSDFGGQDGLNRRYLVGGVALTWAKWELDISGGLRRSSGAEKVQGSQENISLSYEVMDGLRMGVGYNHVRVGEVDDNGDAATKSANTLAVSAAYGFKF